MSYDPSQVVFLDTETTGLDPERHEVWEVGIIADEHATRLFLDIEETKADLIALGIGGYHERHPKGRAFRDTEDVRPQTIDQAAAARRVANLSHGRHIVGAVPDFDARFLTKLLMGHGLLPSWHYHLIDVEALMVGALAGAGRWGVLPIETVQDNGDIGITLPWKSRDLSRAVGVDPDEFEAHTAMGDARWAQACFEAVMGKPVTS